MVETICQSCGNRKSFEDSHIGKSFKCPSCSNPVTIQNVGSQLFTEPISKTNSFAEEIARAEEKKKKQDEEARRKNLIKANGKKIKNYLVFAVIIGTPGIILLLRFFLRQIPEDLILGLSFFGLGVFLMIRRGKLQRGD